MFAMITSFLVIILGLFENNAEMVVKGRRLISIIVPKYSRSQVLISEKDHLFEIEYALILKYLLFCLTYQDERYII